jgi:hypothetical protein
VVLSVLLSALQLHPTVPDLWVRAAQFEVEQNQNYDNARVLFQVRSFSSFFILVSGLAD